MPPGPYIAASPGNHRGVDFKKSLDLWLFRITREKLRPTLKHALPVIPPWHRHWPAGVLIRDDILDGSCMGLVGHNQILLGHGPSTQQMRHTAAIDASSPSSLKSYLS